jgi:hypothetical protein
MQIILSRRVRCFTSTNPAVVDVEAGFAKRRIELGRSHLRFLAERHVLRLNPPTAPAPG